MQCELRELNLDILNSMHQQAHNRLHKSLHNGADEEEIVLQQDFLAELSLAINYQLRRRFSNPAESPRRYRTPLSNQYMMQP